MSGIMSAFAGTGGIVKETHTVTVYAYSDYVSGFFDSTHGSITTPVSGALGGGTITAASFTYDPTQPYNFYGHIVIKVTGDRSALLIKKLTIGGTIVGTDIAGAYSGGVTTYEVLRYSGDTPFNVFGNVTGATVSLVIEV